MHFNTAADLRDFILQSVENRALALGGFFTDLNLTDGQLHNIEQDVRFAREWERRRVQSAMRRAELNAQRLALLETERRGVSSVPMSMGAVAQKLRAQAISSLQLHAEAIAAKAQEELQKQQLASSLSAQGDKRIEAVLPSVVLNIDVGGGRIERLELRDGDDVDELAAAFVRRHGLPQHTVDVLATEAVKALQEQHG